MKTTKKVQKNGTGGKVTHNATNNSVQLVNPDYLPGKSNPETPVKNANEIKYFSKPGDYPEFRGYCY